MFFSHSLFYSLRVKLLLFKIVNSDHKQAILKHSAIGSFLQLLRAVLAAPVLRVIDGSTNHLYSTILHAVWSVARHNLILHFKELAKQLRLSLCCCASKHTGSLLTGFFR